MLEFQAFGHLMQRDGNRGPTAAPQNVYRCADVEGDGESDASVAVTVETDDQWKGLCRVLGADALPTQWGTFEGRRAAHDDIDQWIAKWCRHLTTDEVVGRLWPAGVPVATVLAPAEVQDLAQLKDRGFLETSLTPWPGIRSSTVIRFDLVPAPSGSTADRHLPRVSTTHEILVDLLGVEPDEYQRLLATDVIGNRLLGKHRTR